MPRTATDYSNTIIYKIQNIDNPKLLYIGSTTDFTKRKSAHKSECGNPRKNHKKVYTMINQNGGWSMFNMIELYKFPCEDKRQAECEEDRCIREMKANMNMKRAFITPNDIVEYQKQYREQNKEQIAEQMKQYYEQNKEQIAEQYKHYREQNKERIAEQKKQYREQNKEQIAERDKQYREQNKERMKQKITCECGCVIGKCDLARHKRSKKHQDFMKSIEQ